MNTRRDFLTTVAALLASGNLLKWTQLASAQTVSRTKKIRERLNVATMDADHPILKTYIAAVSAMREGVYPNTKKPLPKEFLWESIAAIHGNYCGSIHATWQFLPWHRAYLVTFEEIIRQITGDEDFALPYWDWTHNPQLPAIFEKHKHLTSVRREKSDETLLEGRGFIDKTGKIITKSISEANMSFILGQKEFKDFGGTSSSNGLLEIGPHNDVHFVVGGLKGHMSAFSTAAKDPIFWLHHSNVDRIWTQWSGAVPVAATGWQDLTLTQFTDRVAKPQSFKNSQMLSTEALGYRYSQSGSPAITRRRATVGREIARAAVAINTAVQFNKSLDLRLDNTSAIESIVSQLSKLSYRGSGQSTTPAKAIFLNAEMNLPTVPVGTTASFFISCPYLQSSTPITSDHHVHTTAFFSGGAAQHNHNHDSRTERFFTDITEMLLRLRNGGSIKASDLVPQMILTNLFEPEKHQASSNLVLKSLTLHEGEIV